MKKVIAVIFVLILVLSSSFVCFAESPEGEENYSLPKAKVDAMVVLGDSISTGYALEGYDSESDNADIASYANLVASYYGLTMGENYFNYAKDGATSADLHLKLANELSEEERENIAKADVVLMTIGGNDFLGILYAYMAELLELGENASIEQAVIKLVTMNEEGLQNLEKKAKAFYDDKKQEIEVVYNQVGEHISSISSLLNEIAPDAQIYVQSLYNPANELPPYKALEILNEHIISKMINALNDEIFERADKEGFYKIDVFSEFSGRKEACTNISDFDVHPNEYGHSLIADALCLKIDTVYKELNSNDKSDFSEGEDKYTWMWFAGAALVVVIAVPVVFFVVKKSSDTQN